MYIPWNINTLKGNSKARQQGTTDTKALPEFLFVLPVYVCFMGSHYFYLHGHFHLHMDIGTYS